ncbi:type II toxin-antitoxin system mRNA interferase toxin, RelE/StbE family [Patescibacteria group bacterium]|nr:type II toxin-antitoxin system mRNA interferase toxin, RelE/StbE family [Patescibacteria group bacterium]
MRIGKTIIRYTTHFARAFKKLNPELRDLLKTREAIFRENIFDSRLRTHPLRGELNGFYSFSITYKYRILFKIEKDGSATFINVGDHSIYD